MQLTPEQRADMQRQLEENPDRRSFRMEFTPEQRAEWERAVTEEEADRPANMARLKRMDGAIAEESLSGEVRRAIRDARRPYITLAAEVGVTPQQLLDFRSGDAPLSSDALDRLIDVLGLSARLVATPVGREDQH
ncbi:MAG: hypothetical protein AB7U20_11020 [Planctomycetaceae bacterium]